MIHGRRERADAVRNRQAILQATEELLIQTRPELISMEQVAAAAGVGKGTVFHRFGSRMGLMTALMEERATVLHEAVLAGPPPLGPGAPARDRLVAFLDAVVALVARNKGLLAALGHAVIASNRPPGGGPHPIHAFWHEHLTDLIEQVRPDLDADMLADILLSPLYSDPIVRRLEIGERDRLTAAMRAVVADILGESDRLRADA
jgi:AcrR family transcriptional regulator